MLGMLNLRLIFILFGGSFIGIVCGAIPGITATMSLVLLLPWTYNLEPSMGLALLLAVYVNATYGGSVSAILLNIPGTPASMMTGVEGYVLAERGEAGRALGIATVCSFWGGIFSAVVLMLLAPALGKVALAFGPAEYFAIGIFSLGLIASMMTKNIIKGLVAAVLGVFVGCIGLDPVSGVPRYTFGVLNMTAGLNLVPLLIGFFGFKEVLKQIGSCREPVGSVHQISRLLPTWKDLKLITPTTLRSSVLGTVIGILPGAGGPIASFLAYQMEVSAAKNKPNEFGRGDIRGVAASETANNAVTGGALIPLLTLGVPGDGATAVVLAAFMMHNITPGPTLFTQRPELITSIYMNFVIACFLMLVLGFIGSKIFMQTLKVPQSILVPSIALICFIASFSARNNVFDVIVMVVAGIATFLMEKRGFPTIPLVLGAILSSMIEVKFRGALQIDSTGLIFFKKPISGVLLVLTIIIVVNAIYKQFVLPLYKKV